MNNEIKKVMTQILVIFDKLYLMIILSFPFCLDTKGTNLPAGRQEIKKQLKLLPALTDLLPSLRLTHQPVVRALSSVQNQ